MYFINVLQKIGMDRSYVNAGFFLVSSSLFQRVSNTVFTIILARLLTKEEFGKFGLVFGAVSMFNSFAGMGMGSVATKFISELLIKDKVRLGRVISFIFITLFFSVTLISIALILFAGFISETIYGIPELSKPLMLSSILIFSNLFFFVMQGAIIGFEEYRRLLLSNIIFGSFLIVGVSLLKNYLTLNLLILHYSISYAMGLVYLIIVFRHRCLSEKIKIRFRGFLSEYKIWWEYSLPSLLMGSMIGPSEVFAQSVLAKSENGIAGMGTYTAAIKWQTVVSFIPMSLSRQILPKVSKELGKGNLKKAKNIVYLNILTNFGISIVILSVFFVFISSILRLYGSEYSGDAGIFLLCVSVGLVESVSCSIAPFATASNKMWNRTFIHIFWTISLVSLSYFFIPKYGVIGLAWSQLGTRVLNAILYCFLFKHCCNHWESVNGKT